MVKRLSNYIIGKDLFEDINKHPDKSLIQKVESNLFVGVDLLRRYAPIPLEIDGIRRLVDKQYIVGGLELIFAEYLRISEYYSNKKIKIIKDKINEISRPNEEHKQVYNYLVKTINERLKEKKVNSSQNLY